jgi:hypothetical protein
VTHWYHTKQGEKDICRERRHESADESQTAETQEQRSESWPLTCESQRANRRRTVDILKLLLKHVLHLSLMRAESCKDVVGKLEVDDEMPQCRSSNLCW